MEIKDILGLGETSTKLIDVVAKGIGIAWNPIQIRLEAGAKAYEIKKIAEAVNSVNNAQKSIEYNNGDVTLISDKGLFPLEAYTELSSRITDRTMYQQAKKQLNLENTIYFADEELRGEKNISNEPVDEDWITRFFKIAEDVSNEEMQKLWGRILSGEIKKPKSYSLRTMEMLKNITQDEAEIFRKVSQYSIKSNNKSFFIKDDSIMNSEKINFSDLLLLQDLGLIFSNELEYSFNPSPKGEVTPLIYGNYVVLLNRDEDTPKIPFHVYVYTQVGIELLNLIDINIDISYIQMIAKKVAHINGLTLSYAEITHFDQDLIHHKELVKVS